MNMVLIPIDEFVEKYDKTNRKFNKKELKDKLINAVKDKNNGATCFQCS